MTTDTQTVTVADAYGLRLWEAGTLHTSNDALRVYSIELLDGIYEVYLGAIVYIRAFSDEYLTYTPAAPPAPDPRDAEIARLRETILHIIDDSLSQPGERALYNGLKQIEALLTNESGA